MCLIKNRPFVRIVEIARKGSHQACAGSKWKQWKALIPVSAMPEFWCSCSRKHSANRIMIRKQTIRYHFILLWRSNTFKIKSRLQFKSFYWASSLIEWFTCSSFIPYCLSANTHFFVSSPSFSSPPLVWHQNKGIWLQLQISKKVGEYSVKVMLTRWQGLIRWFITAKRVYGRRSVF